MVPANRIGYTELSIGQLKIMQEVITLAIFVPFSVLYMQQPLKLDYCGRGCVCKVPSILFFARERRPERMETVALFEAPAPDDATTPLRHTGRPFPHP